MNNSIAPVISRNRELKRGTLIGYLPIGFPDLQSSIDAAVVLAENGVDALELGIPYSDPVMDGPLIQRATQQALEGGFKLSQVFTAVEQVRNRTGIPVLVMSYWNPILQFGVEKFANELSTAGGSGIITPDLIPDDAKSWLDASDQFGLDRVFLAAPTSTSERLEMIAKQSRGFVYAVSTMGTTGTRTELDSAAKGLVARLRSAGATEICVGLGISSHEQVQDVLSYADGAIVGSAFIAALESGGLDALALKARTLRGGV